MKIDREQIQKILDYRHKIVLTKGRLAAGALVLVVIFFLGWLVLIRLGKFGYRETSEVELKFQGDCSILTEEECRRWPDCVPLGKPGKEAFALGEREIFVFEACVERVKEYADCPEVVKLTLFKKGSKFIEKCRCCCGEGHFCNPEKPYPEK